MEGGSRQPVLGLWPSRPNFWSHPVTARGAPFSHTHTYVFWGHRPINRKMHHPTLQPTAPVLKQTFINNAYVTEGCGKADAASKHSP